MAEEVRIKERVEGERQHLWWDSEKYFPFMAHDRGWQFCPYCGGLKFKAGEKYIFPNYSKNEKGEDAPVEKDIGCLNFKPLKPEPKKEEAVQSAPEVKTEEKQEPPPAAIPEKPEKPAKKGILRNFRK
jgi:hypothetical protein